MAVEFIECSSLSISYDATGKATIALAVLRDDTNELSDTYTNRSWGGVRFDCVLMGATQKPIIGSGGWTQWALQMEGVGN